MTCPSCGSPMHECTAEKCGVKKWNIHRTDGDWWACLPCDVWIAMTPADEKKQETEI